MGLDILLQFPGALIIDSFGLVVQPAVFEYSFDVVAEAFAVFILVVGQFLFDGFDVGGVFHNQSVVRDVLDGDGFAEGPDGGMLFEQLNNVLAL